jgi:transcriptional/translational regulatory protein YebC/TACO1
LTAIRSGGGNTNPESNLNLKTAIDKAREVNMPKENVERLLQRFEERKANLMNFYLEAYGPSGVPIVLDVETDNKNRTLGEIKLIFRDNGGTLGESNSVMFQFKKIGEVELTEITEEKQLDLIDAGAQDFEGKVAIVDVGEMNSFVNKVKEMGIEVVRSEMVLRSINPIMLKTEEELMKVMDLIDSLEEHDDIISVSAGFDYAQKN